MRQLSRSDEGAIWAVPGNPEGERDQARFLEKIRSYSGVPGLLEAKILRTHDLETCWFDPRYQFVEVTSGNRRDNYSHYLVPPHQAARLLDGHASIEEIKEASTDRLQHRPDPVSYLRPWLRDS